MGIIQRKGFVTTLVIYLGVALGYINVVMLFPKYFTPEDLGLRSTLVDFATLVSQLAMFGFTGVLLKFFPHFRDKETKERSAFVWIGLLIPLLAFSVLAVLIFFFQDLIKGEYIEKAPAFVEYFYLVFPLILFITFNTLLDAHCRNLMHTVYSNFLREVVLRINFFLLIVLVAVDVLTKHQFWLGLVATYGLNTMLLLGFVMWKERMFVRPNFSVVGPMLKTDILSFALFTLVSGTATVLVFKIDSLMISGIVDLEGNGIYTMALFIATLVEIPRRALIQVASPMLSAAFQEEDMDKVEEIYKKMSINLLLAGGFVMGGICLSLEDIYSLIPNGERFASGFWVAVLISGAKLLDMLFSTNNELIVYSKYYKYNLYFLLFLMVCAIGSNYLFISALGITGAAGATLLSFLLFNLVKWYFIKNRMGFSPFGKSTIKAFAVLGLSAITAYYLPAQGFPLLDILMRSVVFTLILGVLIYFGNVSEDVNQLVSKFFRKSK